MKTITKKIDWLGERYPLFVVLALIFGIGEVLHLGFDLLISSEPLRTAFLGFLFNIAAVLFASFLVAMVVPFLWRRVTGSESSSGSG